MNFTIPIIRGYSGCSGSNLEGLGVGLRHSIPEKPMQFELKALSKKRSGCVRTCREISAFERARSGRKHLSGYPPAEPDNQQAITLLLLALSISSRKTFRRISIAHGPCFPN